MTDEQLNRILPDSTQANRNKYLMYFNRYEIDTPLRIATFKKEKQ